MHNINQCAMRCCQNEHCNVALTSDETCYHIACVSDESCFPIPSQKIDASRHVQMVLIRPVSNDETWDDILGNVNYENGENDQINRERLSHFLNNERLNFDDSFLNGMWMDSTTYGNEYDFKKPIRECEVGVNSLCAMNEVCESVNEKSRSGTCQCKEEYVRNGDGSCVLDIVKNEYVASKLTDKIIPVNTSTKETSTANMKQLTVSVQSKEVIIIYFNDSY